jgi:Anti-sigma-K factor rskA
MPLNRGPELGHQTDAAGWALGALDRDDALAFEEHLPGCKECQRAVSEFQLLAEALRRPPAEIEPPPDLEERTLIRVLQAAAATRHPPGQEAAGKIIRWPRGRRPVRLLAAGAALAAAVAVIATAVVLPLAQGGRNPSGRVAAEFSLESVLSTFNAGGQATAYLEPTGYKIVLHLHGLAATGPGEYYGCWYVGPKNRLGQAQLISAGSFTVGRSGTADPTMWSAASPGKFTTMEITTDTGTGATPGKQILVGHAAP